MMNKNYIETMSKYWDTSHWIISVCDFKWNDWNRLSQDEQKQFEKELQVVVKKYRNIAKAKECNNDE